MNSVVETPLDQADTKQQSQASHPSSVELLTEPELQLVGGGGGVAVDWG